MHIKGTGQVITTICRRRRQAFVGAVAVLALMVPLVGCGTTNDQADTAGGKAGGSVPAEPVVLRMLNAAGSGESQDFVSEVDKLSGGLLRIEVVDSWHSDGDAAASSEQDVINAVHAGDSPLGISPVRAWHEHGVSSFDALIALLLIERPAVQAAVLHSEVATEMLSSLDGSGLTGIGILPGPMRHPVGVTRDLIDVADYDGASIATPPSVVVEKSLQALGATTTTTLFNGAPVTQFDGFDQQISSVAGNGYDDPSQSITTNVTLGPRPLVLFGNAAALDGMTEQNRDYLRQAAESTIDIKTQNDHAFELEDLGVLCRRGAVAFVQASQSQVDALRAKLDPAYQWLRQDATTAGFLDRIQELSGSTPVNPAIDAIPECPVSDQSPVVSAEPHIASPIDGTYTVSTTADDLQAAGIPSADLIPENFGESVYVYDRGRFATTSHNDEACVWAYGRYTVDGAVLIWDFEGGGGQSPNGATNKPGEQFGFNWSMYRDVLTLTNKEGMISPMADGNRWEFQRISTTPDPAALSQQCPPPAEAFSH